MEADDIETGDMTGLELSLLQTYNIRIGLSYQLTHGGAWEDLSSTFTFSCLIIYDASSE